MPMPKDVRALFQRLPQARAERDEREKQAELDREAAARDREADWKARREALRAEVAVTWDWLQSDGQELAGELERASLQRVELVGPLDEAGQACGWQLGARVFVLSADGELEVARQDEYRALRYVHRTADELLETEPPGVLRALVDAVRTGAVWQRVAEQVRAVTADPVDGGG